ncbi:xanthine dehydrogenase family protein subunit M [Rhodocytophaga aerolata]|uniref:Xanthine dehydrogenase family protein subunit M n=1 Tax=Rhodocytophaga aerolata TaxID=455078 RepID=A0ABT8R0R4_9BACT|nr:xanthine dehydrogenase family protein subunit M [Rhodocytophaga aerolata]MDO1445685.1 xanthine dehydrogenase family protein subunit M [Rhodocytophaga aerolata]
MIPVEFDYKKAISVEEALEALSSGDSKLLAGGYSLIPAMKLRLNQPSMLIDIGGIASLKGIEEEDGQIIIKAGTTHNDILNNDLIKTHLPFFHEAASMIGDVQVRNRGTIGGSLAHADPAADWPALVLVAEATIDVVGTGGKRNIKAADFFTGLFTTALAENEIITAIRIPIPANGSRMVYLKFENPASRFAVVGCAVLRSSDKKTTIAFTGVADYAFRDTAAEQVVSGKILDTNTIADAMNAAVYGVNVLSDNFASEDYRRHLAKVYLKRALQAIA